MISKIIRDDTSAEKCKCKRTFVNTLREGIFMCDLCAKDFDLIRDKPVIELKKKIITIWLEIQYYRILAIALQIQNAYLRWKLRK